jgi:hypothetical protein
MPVLHLGVYDFPYKSQPTSASKGKGKKSKTKSKLKSSTAWSTGDVAEILEAKYHVMEIFFQLKENKIAKSLENSLAGALESLMMGAPPTLDPFGAATANLDQMFKDFLTNKEMEKVGYPGVPTQAALKGINHRLLHPYSSNNPRRPSFIDTGQFQSSFHAWIE